MMNDPHPGQRIWAIGLEGTFVIMAVHRGQRSVDLESIHTHKAEKNVSFDVINPLGGDISQARFR
jgi:hypothetical protein